MLKNYLLIALRNAWRNKVHSLINLLGLAVGMSCSTLIFLFVLDELSFDRHNEHIDNIYRICIKGKIQGEEVEAALSNAPMGAALKSDFPEVEDFTRVYTFDGDPVVRYGEKVFIEEDFYHADSTFFNVFTSPALYGVYAQMLNRPNTVVLTEEIAQKYFGDEDPLGKLLLVGQDESEYEVTGVVKGFPENSHFHFNMLGSMTSIYLADVESWLGNNSYTYICLSDDADPIALEAQFPELVAMHIGPDLENLLGITLEEFHEAGNHYGYFLQSLKDIHLRSDLQFEIEPGGSQSSVIIFSIIAVFILFVASINFMNMSTAGAATRATEVGVRKLTGADRGRLIRQFLTESFIITLAALVLSVVLVEMALPGFNRLTDKSLALSHFSPSSIVMGLLGLGLVIGFFSGTYPAFFLSSFRPVQVLKSGAMHGLRGKGLRKLLVTFQFVVTIVLFICTIVVYRQMSHIQNKDLGFNEKEVVVIDRIHVLGSQLDAFRQELLRNPSISDVSASSTVPGGLFGDNVYLPAGADNDQTHSINNMWADQYFGDCYELEVVEGRWFDDSMPTDSSALILNESAARALGVDFAMDSRMLFSFGEKLDVPREVIGIVKDFHFQSLHREIRPLVIEHAGNNYKMSVRILPGQTASTMEYISEIWASFVPQQPIHMSFLEDDLVEFYRNDRKTASVFFLFSILSIFIASLGLLGMASFTAVSRTKEVGIRKAMGATISSVLLTLSKEYLWLILLASLVAWPIAYFAMNNWLQDYPSRAEMNPGIFLLSSLLALLISSITVLLRIYQSASRNPVTALRYE